MSKINESRAKKFLNSIKKGDRVAVVHHDDLDGFASGVLFYNFARNKGAKVKNFLGGYGLDPKKLNKYLDKFNKIILTDLGPNFVKTLNPVLEKKDVLYTDHHPAEFGIPKNVLELGIQPERGVNLVANGKCVGKGELLQIGDVIGVKITKLGE